MQKTEILKQSPLFEMLSAPELEFVADLCRPRGFAPNELVFEEGDLGDALYVIVAGEVEVLRVGRSQAITTLRSPQFFGEMSLIDKEYRSATVRAKGECTLLQLTAENLSAFRKRHRDGFTFLVINIARVLCSRLREANNRLASGG